MDPVLIAAVGGFIVAAAPAVVVIMKQRHTERTTDVGIVLKAWAETVEDLRKKDSQQEEQIDKLFHAHLECERRAASADAAAAIAKAEAQRLKLKVESWESKHEIMVKKIETVEQEVKDVGNRSFPPPSS